jgi:hypothetical protein
MNINLRDAAITIKDGTGTPQTVTLKVGEGNLTWTEKRTIEYIRDRGIIDTVREGDDEPVDVSFDIMWETLDSSTSGFKCPFGIIKGDSDYVSTGNACEPYACDIEIVIANAGCGINETVTLADFRYEELSYDLRGGSISCSGKCNIKNAAIS